MTDITVLPASGKFDQGLMIRSDDSVVRLLIYNTDQPVEITFAQGQIANLLAAFASMTNVVNAPRTQNSQRIVTTDNSAAILTAASGKLVLTLVYAPYMAQMSMYRTAVTILTSQQAFSCFAHLRTAQRRIDMAAKSSQEQGGEGADHVHTDQ